MCLFFLETSIEGNCRILKGGMAFWMVFCAVGVVEALSIFKITSAFNANNLMDVSQRVDANKGLGCLDWIKFDGDPRLLPTALVV